MNNRKDLIKIFAFTDKEKKVWKLLSDYSEKVNHWINQNIMTDEQLLRFALIGLFVEYRASNHRGESFSTDIQTVKVMESKKDKYDAVNRLLGRSIASTQDYLSLIKLTDTKQVNGEALFNFVISGRPM